MLDFRCRSVSFEMDGTWYLVTFRTLPFGRVGDVRISQSDRKTGFYYTCGAKIDTQTITAKDALKMFWVSLAEDVKAAKRRISPRLLLRR